MLIQHCQTYAHFLLIKNIFVLCFSCVFLWNIQSSILTCLWNAMNYEYLQKSNIFQTDAEEEALANEVRICRCFKLRTYNVTYDHLNYVWFEFCQQIPFRSTLQMHHLSRQSLHEISLCDAAMLLRWSSSNVELILALILWSCPFGPNVGLKIWPSFSCFVQYVKLQHRPTGNNHNDALVAACLSSSWGWEARNGQ